MGRDDVEVAIVIQIDEFSADPPCGLKRETVRARRGIQIVPWFMVTGREVNVSGNKIALAGLNGKGEEYCGGERF